VVPVSNDVEVLILQHPLETSHAKNTARLLHLSLPRSQILVGEAFDDASLHTALQAPKYTLLLYPRATPPQPDPSPAPAPTQLKSPARLRLVVLDGTWRKSRKMLHTNPWLHSLPRWSLDDVPPSNYLIRKAHRPGQLSTLEATCAALGQLEGNTHKYQPLLDAFDGFVAQQLACRPAPEPTHAGTF
jgi:DTW domain-containing protein YfiP